MLTWDVGTVSTSAESKKNSMTKSGQRMEHDEYRVSVSPSVNCHDSFHQRPNVQHSAIALLLIFFMLIFFMLICSYPGDSRMPTQDGMKLNYPQGIIDVSFKWFVM